MPPPDPDDPPRPAPPWTEFARAPLIPVALAATLGLIADRYVGVTTTTGLAAAGVGVVVWAVSRRSPLPVWLAVAGLAAAHHHAHRCDFPPDDVGEYATPEPRLCRLRATLTDDPVTRYAPKADPLAGPAARHDRDAATLRATGIEGKDGGWLPASGLARLTVERPADVSGSPPLLGLRAGDSVELVGLLSRPRSPGNPGEPDYAGALLDQRIRAEVRITDTAAGVTRVGGADWSADGVVFAARRNALAALADHLPDRQVGPAAALLLGDGTAMDRAEWDAYIRTGVVHALAISGQHLAVLGGFVWLLLRAADVRRARGAWLVVGLVVGYAVLTGLRPSGVRAAAMTVAVCGALVLHRRNLPANAFALGWLTVLVLNPADPFSLGCKLSFLSVFVLVWGVGRWVRPRLLTPLEQLVEESRPIPVRLIRAAGRAVAVAYLVSLVIWAANLPLLLAEQNIVSPVAVLIGPPVVLLTSVALVAGFLLILVSPLGPVAAPFALLTGLSLDGCGRLVRFADALPGGAVYLPGPPLWWLIGFYFGVSVVVLVGPSVRLKAAAGLAAWVAVAVLWPRSGTPDELRVTFLSVGHGGCAVLETPDGRCLLYDAGSTAGPAVVRRVVAPYLWHSGIRRIDELFVSHADADHFNGVAELVRRFPVGQVTLTPSFADKPTVEVAVTLDALEKAGVPRRVASVGQRFTAGGVELEVLHPPPAGPPGTENERSLVLHVRYAGRNLLLTGDLEKVGTAWVLDRPPVPVDVLLAPHHGSRAALPRRLVEWASPGLVVVSRGPARGTRSARRTPPGQRSGTRSHTVR
ncbi:MAG: ComEC/Rec2 family competence protein [Gemmataceae bacterium]